MHFKEGDLKILVFSDIYPPPFIGGAEEAVFDLVNSLIQMGCKVQVLSLKSRRNKSISPVMDRANNPYQVKEYFDFPYHPGLDGTNRSRVQAILWHILHIMAIPHLISIWRTLKKNPPDVIYCGNIGGWSLTPWMLSKVLGKPIVQHVHDYGFICSRRTLRKKNFSTQNCGGNCFTCIPRKTITKLFWPGGTLIFVSESQKLLHQLEKKILRNSVIEICHPTVQEFPTSFRPIVEREFEFGYLGRIAPEKGIEFALSALQRLGKKLFLAGNGSEDYQQILISRFPNAVFLGHQDKWEFLNRVKTLIVPSVWDEPAGRIVREGLIIGCLVVVSNRGGLIEMGGILPANIKVFELENENSLVNLLDSIDYHNIIEPDDVFYEQLKVKMNNLPNLIIATSKKF
jgi:glycosyltransferase involved in cell wall biosynthesis